MKVIRDVVAIAVLAFASAAWASWYSHWHFWAVGSAVGVVEVARRVCIAAR